MKKHTLSVVLGTLLTVSVLSGCLPSNGNETTEEVSDNDNRTANSDPSEIGAVIEEDGIKKVTVYADDELGINDESGTFRYTIDAVNLATVTADTDVAARSLGIDKGTEAAMLTINISAENVGYEGVNCYISQASLTTDSGEKVEPKSLLGDYIDGHFGAGEKKSGSNVYIFKETKSQDINRLTLNVSSPKDGDFKPVGDDVELTFSLRK